MSYILTCDNCTCRCIKFIEQNGELLLKGIGKTYIGTIALQTFNDRDDMRITLADSKNVYSGVIKRIILPGNTNYLCHFDFNDSERKNKQKLLKMQVQTQSLGICGVLACYDFSNHTGVNYLFPNLDEMKTWAKALGISTYESLDSEGTLISVRSVNNDL